MPQIEPRPQVPCKVSSPFVPVPATAPTPTLFEIWDRAIPLAPSLGAGEEQPALLCSGGSLTQVRGRFIPQMRYFWPDPRHRSPTISVSAVFVRPLLLARRRATGQLLLPLYLREAKGSGYEQHPKVIVSCSFWP